MDKDTWALKLGKLVTEAKERRSAAAAAMSRTGTQGETVRQSRARMQAEEARLQDEEARRQDAIHQHALENGIALESLPENPMLHEHEHLDSEMAGLQAQISELEGERAKLQADNAELVRDVLNLRGKVEGLETTVASLRDELALLRSHSQGQTNLRKSAAHLVTQQTHRKRSQ
jgi:chromosome segregation ATPase